MSTEKPWTREEAERVLDHLAELIQAGDAAEISGDLKDSGHDVNGFISRVRDAAFAALKEHRQRRLLRARQRYRENSLRIQGRAGRPGTSGEERRLMFSSLISARPELLSALTMQYRDLNELTDADIDSALEELEILGALEDPR